MSPHRLGKKILMFVPLISIILLTQFDDIESLPQNSEDLPAPLAEEKLDYSILKELGVSCHPLDTCSKPRKEDSLQTMNCECGERCVKHGTCCIDSPFVNDKVPNEHKEECVPVDRDLSVFMVNRCKSGWRGDSQVISKCHDIMETPGDPQISVPVTNQITKVTYRNRYCALCNGVGNEVHPWVIPVDGNVDKEAQNVSRDIQKRVVDNIVNSNESKSSGMGESVTPGQGKFIPLDGRFGIPENLKPSLIHCRSHLVSTCAPTWNDVTTRKRCESYMAAVYLTENKTESKSILGFHNIHCALCNFIPKGMKHSCTRRRGNKGRPAIPFAILLDINRSDGDVVGEISRCKINEMYDPYFKKCKRMMCALPGYVVKGDKCVPPG